VTDNTTAVFRQIEQALENDLKKLKDVTSSSGSNRIDSSTFLHGSSAIDLWVDNDSDKPLNFPDFFSVPQSDDANVFNEDTLENQSENGNSSSKTPVKEIKITATYHVPIYSHINYEKLLGIVRETKDRTRGMLLIIR